MPTRCEETKMKCTHTVPGLNTKIQEEILVNNEHGTKEQK